ncbi:hypothetical protein MRX96_056154, partial [Rhipicephalus microplus]
VYVVGDASDFHFNQSTNSTANSLTLNNLKKGASYEARVVALTTAGGGPASRPIHFKMENPAFSTSISTPLQNVVTQPWFIALFGLLLLTAATVFVIFLLRKRRLEHTKTVITVPVRKQEDIRNCFDSLSDTTCMSPHEALWIDQIAWRASDTIKEPFCEIEALNKMSCASNDLNYSSVYAPLNRSIDATDYAEVDTYNLTTFYKKDISSMPEPYATTTLINPSFHKSLSGSTKDSRSGYSAEESNRTSDKAFDLELKGTGEDGVTHRLLESNEVASPAGDSGSYTTDGYGMSVKKSCPKFSCGLTVSRVPLMNWSEIIPPQLEEPPRKVGSQINTAGSLRRTPPHDIQPNENLQPSGIQLSQNSTIMQVLPRLPVPSPKTSLNQSSNGLLSSNTDPHQGDACFWPRENNLLFKLSQSQQLQEQIFSNPFMDISIQSSLPSHNKEPTAFYTAAEQQGPRLATLQGHIYQHSYAESDVEDASQPQSCESSVAEDTNFAPSHTPSWSSTAEQSNSSCTSGCSSGASSYHDSVYNEGDFASAVMRAAQNAGFHVNESVISTVPPSAAQARATPLRPTRKL